MGELDIAGADLSGRGPALLLIGDECYDELADLLKPDYTVIRYTAPPAHDALVADDASAVDEALAVVDAVAGGGAAYVFGSGVGAVVGLELIARYSGRVRLLVAHEPSDRLGEAPLEALAAVADKVVPAAGRESARMVETAEVIARRVGWPVVVFPGGRQGYATDAVEFAELLHKVLASESS